MERQNFKCKLTNLIIDVFWPNLRSRALIKPKLFGISCIHEDTTNLGKNRFDKKKGPKNYESYSYREFNASFPKLQLFVR